MPWVAGCCGPMLRTMSPVSSSTFICASARCRYNVGSTSISGSSPGCGRSVRCGRHPSPPSALGVSLRPESLRSRVRRASARRRRVRAMASPRGRAAGSPCGADGLRTPTGDRGGAGSDGRRRRSPYISHVSRSCQSAPGYTATHDSACGLSVVDVDLERDAEGLHVRRLDVREHLHPARRNRRRRTSSPWAAPARTCHPSLPRRSPASASSRSPATNDR